MATKLGLYNQALTEHLEERRLVSLTENREARRVMDDVWDGPTLGACLSAGLWNFAIRTAMYEASPSISPDFGYSYAFDKPTDWVRTVGIASDEMFSQPLIEFNDETGFWFANLDTIYVRWVSNDTDYGMNLAGWPANFERYVAAALAAAACGRITGSRGDKQAIAEDVKRLLSTAKNTDAMDEGAKFAPTGTWARSRSGSTRRDGGSRTRLIG
jgi:hypothetical protein